MTDEAMYTALQIEELTGITVRAHRHWISVGLLDGPRGRGPSARYDAAHVDRVRVIQQLRHEGAQLDEIRRRFKNMKAKEYDALVAQVTSATATAAPTNVPAGPPPVALNATTAYDVIELMPGLMLMVSQTRELPRRVASDICKHYGSG